MKKLHTFYLTTWIAIAGFITGIALIGDFDKSLDGVLFVVCLLATLILELLYVPKGRNIRTTYVAPLLVIMSFYEPFYALLSVTVVQILANRLKRRWIDFETTHIWDLKMTFQLAVYIILDYLMIVYAQQTVFSSDTIFIASVLMMVLIYVTLEYLAIFGEISLKLEKNIFKEIKVTPLVSALLSYMIISVLGVLIYEAYDTWGLVMMMALIIQLSGNFYFSLFQREVGNKLIYDQMTSAYNRAYFEDIINAKMAHKEPFSILFIDLDDFKSVNDIYGHVLGDALLIDFVAIMKGILRRDNKLFRYGGDEFCIIFDDEKQAIGVKKRIESYTFVYQAQDDHFVAYDVSLGHLNYNGEESRDIKSLLHEVDQNMYADKRKKKKDSDLKEFLI